MNPARIIVGVGDPPGHRPALRWAAAEAIRRRHGLVVVHVARPDPCLSPDRPEAWATGHAAAIVTSAIQEARDLAPGVRVTGEAVTGCPAATMVAMAARHDLLVVGTRHRPGSATADLVARNARSSVVVVRGRSEPETGPVAVGYDGSPSAEPVLASAFEAAAVRHCPVTVIRAARLSAPGRTQYDARSVRAAFAVDARRAVEPFTDKYPEVDVDILVVGGDPAGHLAAASRDARLLVTGPGPAVGHLLRHSACPVLVARA